MSSEDEENEIAESDTAEAEPAPAAVRDEPVELRSSETRRKLRDQVQADVEAFLKAGGRIEQVEPNASAQGTSLTATAGNEVS